MVITYDISSISPGPFGRWSIVNSLWCDWQQWVCLCVSFVFMWARGGRREGGMFFRSLQLFSHFGCGITFWGCHGGCFSLGTLGGMKTLCFLLPGLSWRFFTSVWFMKALLALFSLLLVSYLVLLVWGFEMRQRTLFSPLIIVFWTSLWEFLFLVPSVTNYFILWQLDTGDWHHQCPKYWHQVKITNNYLCCEATLA